MVVVKKKELKQTLSALALRGRLCRLRQQYGNDTREWNIMKTTYRTTHSYKPHSRAERALVLAVLTALLAGGG